MNVSQIKKRNIMLWGFGIAGLLFVLLLVLFFFYIGNLLVVEDDYEQADVTVVLMGSLLDRTLYATDLYHEGKAQKIITVRSRMPGKQYVEARGITVATDADRSKQLAMELDVPANALLVLDGEADSTQDEARIIRSYIEEQVVTLADEGKRELSIAIVTSKYHSYRSKEIFEKIITSSEALQNAQMSVKIYSSPSPYDPFEPDGWWKSRADTRNVIFESLKLINFYLREQFQ